MKLSIILTLIFLVLSTSLSGTFQRGDYVEFDAHLYRIMDTTLPSPLESYLKENDLKVPSSSDPEATNLYRGYIALWRVKDKRLFLISIFIPNPMYYSSDSIGPLNQFTIYPLENLFPEESPVVFASWFSGEMTITHNSFDSHQKQSEPEEKDLILKFKDGNIDSIETKSM